MPSRSSDKRAKRWRGTRGKIKVPMDKKQYASFFLHYDGETEDDDRTVNTEHTLPPRTCNQTRTIVRKLPSHTRFVPLIKFPISITISPPEVEHFLFQTYTFNFSIRIAPEVLLTYQPATSHDTWQVIAD